jgi:hypothetical protein
LRDYRRKRLVRLKRRFNRRAAEAYHADHSEIEASLNRRFLFLILCLSVVMIIACFDMRLLPERLPDRDHPESALAFDPPVYNLSLGDRFVSALENILFWVCFLWGFMLFTDVATLLEKKEKAEAFSAFFNLVEYEEAGLNNPAISPFYRKS